MLLSEVPFGITDWSDLSVVEHSGESGFARSRTRLRGRSSRALAMFGAAK